MPAPIRPTRGDRNVEEAHEARPRRRAADRAGSSAGRGGHDRGSDRRRPEEGTAWDRRAGALTATSIPPGPSAAPPRSRAPAGRAADPPGARARDVRPGAAVAAVARPA